MSAPGPLVVVGDALLDRDVEGTVERLSPDAPVPVLDQASVRVRAGGAALAARLAADGERAVVLITALGDDEPGHELAALLARGGVEVVDLGLRGATPEKLRLLAGGRPLLRLDRGGAAAAVGAATAAARAAIGWAAVVLVSDYGRGVAADPGVRAALGRAAGKLPLVWDPHPRGPAPTRGARLVTPNVVESGGATPAAGDDLAAVAARARALVTRWRAEHVCVTCGARGAVLVGRRGPALVAPAQPAEHGDACGAGDRFASAAALALADGADAAEAVLTAVDLASRFVAAGGAAAVADPRGDGDRGPAQRDAVALARAVRDAGGRVVATGGCFDLLHPGHIETLQAARALGDCLVVCLNSDASVRRLKGRGRPVVGQDDRAAVLGALRCVDAVVVFDEDDPVAVIERVRPHVWAKGGDYRGHELPEAHALAAWGGEAVVLPFIGGRSTTRLIEEAGLRAVD